MPMYFVLSIAGSFRRPSADAHILLKGAPFYNDAMKALQRGFANTASKNVLPTLLAKSMMEVLQQYGTVYRLRCSQELFSVRRGERKRTGRPGAAGYA